MNRGSTGAWTVVPQKEVNQAMVGPPLSESPSFTLQSRDCPGLLPARCSRRCSGIVVAGAAGATGVPVGKRSGTGLAAVRGGSGNAQCLRGVSAAFRIRRTLGCGCGVVTPDRIMLAVERAGLGQAGAAAEFGCRDNTGPPLSLGQGMAILPGGRAEVARQ